jgi:uncharacterized protein (TIRG00374 family)
LWPASSVKRPAAGDVGQTRGLLRRVELAIRAPAISEHVPSSVYGRLTLVVGRCGRPRRDGLKEAGEPLDGWRSSRWRSGGLDVMYAAKLRTILSSRALRGAITLVLLAYAIAQLDASELGAIASWKSLMLLLIASSGVITIVIGLNALRWLLVARICQLHIPWGRSFSWTMIGHFFNQIFPSSVGGDVVRGVLAGRGIGDMGGICSSIVLERIVGFIALLTLIAIAQPVLIARSNDRSLSQLAFIAVLLGITSVIAASILAKVSSQYFSGRIQAAARRFFGDTRRLMCSPLLTCSALMVAFVMHISNLLLIAFVANHLGANVSLLDVLVVVPTIVLIASLPVSIGGWGVREAALAIGFAGLGQPASAGVATSLIIGLANLVSSLPGAGAWSWLSPAERSSCGMPKRVETN